MLEKERAFRLAQSLAYQLEMYYKCEEQQAYGYVNPYAVVVNEDGEARLLDIWAEENKEQIVKMQKKKVRILFISPEFVLSQRKRQEDDWFGYGKTVQFLMDKCCKNTELSYGEKKILKKIYNKCTDGKKADISGWRAVQIILVKTQKGVEREKKIQLGRPIVLLVAASFLVGIVLGKQFGGEVKQVVVEKKVEVPVECDENERASEDYLTMLELIQKESLSEEEKTTLNQVLNQTILETEGAEKDWLFQKCVATAYEKLERYEAAIVEYEETLKMVEDSEERKPIYIKLMELYQLLDLPEKADEVYLQVLEEWPELQEDEELLEAIGEEK